MVNDFVGICPIYLAIIIWLFAIMLVTAKKQG